ncbi:uncharacterized protein LOC114264345 [Camellia sinensis]|uniref:uncharacterized protein LOC114264345 n=1 Tax=Camellia sinensis TaxID=4442 RepID=UPI0010358759|nr:uncharacterized protein LOC114264345 [Camellia sinensis]
MQKIKVEVAKHFKNRFCEEWKVRPKLQGVFKTIGHDNDSNGLVIPFSEEEIWRAIRESDGNKAPGPDGFNLFCFQKCWKVFKKDILQFFKEFYDNGCLAKGINSSFITLLPKTENPGGVSDYRPISLIGSLYKILSKVLASRLKKDKWIRWMKVCIQSVRVSVLVNGSPTNEFCLEKRLRQGDPLSPFLFNMVAEGLNILFQRAKALDLIKGAVIGLREVNVTHLQFADDTIVFCEAEENDILSVKRILRCFEVLSGLKINFHKSTVCGVGVQEAEKFFTVDMMRTSASTIKVSFTRKPLEASWRSVNDKNEGLPHEVEPEVKHLEPARELAIVI